MDLVHSYLFLSAEKQPVFVDIIKASPDPPHFEDAQFTYTIQNDAEPGTVIDTVTDVATEGRQNPNKFELDRNHNFNTWHNDAHVYFVRILSELIQDFALESYKPGPFFCRRFPAIPNCGWERRQSVRRWVSHGCHHHCSRRVADTTKRE